MLNRFILLFQNWSIVCITFLKHLIIKWNIKKSTVISISSLILASILLPVAVSYLFFENEINIVHTVATYLVFVLWTLSILIVINPAVMKKIKFNFLYTKKLFILIRGARETFLKDYTAYVQNNLIRKEKHDEFEQYDLVLLDVTYSQLFIIYLTDIEKKLDIELNKILNQNEDNSQNTINISEFYEKVFSNENKITESCFKHSKIQIIDNVLKKLQENAWFEKYYDDVALFNLINVILEPWWKTILYYVFEFKLNETNNNEI